MVNIYDIMLGVDVIPVAASSPFMRLNLRLNTEVFIFNHKREERDLVSSKSKKLIRNILITVASLAASFGISVVLQNVLGVTEHVMTVFVFGVFIVSLFTGGYFFGIFAAFISVFAVNFAFTFPFFAFNFTIPENFISALFMIVISVMTSAMMTKLKIWQELKAEGEREKTRANLLRAVSHDLRTPLTTIYGSSSAMLDSYETLSDGQKIKMLCGIKEDSEWLVRMVENLLSVTRIDEGKIEIIKTPTVLDELVDSAVLKFKKRYPSENVVIDIPDEMIIVKADPMLIGQVIINMLENAVHHAEGRDAIYFRVFALGDKAVFEISDDGCGIDDEKLKTIFTGRYSTDNPPSDGAKRNAGIGLSVCQTIVKAHGARIYAENKKSGGALFRFALDREACEENDE